MLSTQAAPQKRPLLAQVAWLFGRVGNTTFGGGDPTMAVLQREFERRGWITGEQFSIAYGLARITPGTNVLAFCAATGWFVLGIAGAAAAVLAATIPCAALVIWLARLCEIGTSNRWAAAAIAGTVAAAVGMMFAAAVWLTRPQMRPGARVLSIATVAAAFLLARVVGVAPIPILGLAALAGLVWKR